MDHDAPERQSVVALDPRCEFVSIGQSIGTRERIRVGNLPAIYRDHSHAINVDAINASAFSVQQSPACFRAHPGE
jgi:hypothetical protein